MKLSDGDVLIFPEMTLYRYEQNLVLHINLVTPSVAKCG